MRLKNGVLTSLIMFALLPIVLQGCSSRSQPAPVDTLYTGKTYRDFQPNSLDAKKYEVQKGETLYSIAFRANMDVDDIARLNNLARPYTIYPGQTLDLVGSAKSTGTSEPTQRSQSNKQTADRAQNNIKTPVAKTQKKEYGQKVGTKKTVKKQADTRKQRRQKSVRVRTEAAMPSNAELAWEWPSTGKVIERFSLKDRGNKGLDFAGNRGDPVKAAAAGKVVYVGNALRGFGNLIILKHNDDYITAYAHNEDILVKEQEWVDIGETIARMGDSGAQGVKLHFEVRFRGKSVNPEHYLPSSR